MSISPRTLAQLHPGQRGRIDRMEGDDAVAIRLLELGLLPGEEVEVVGLAPLGDPMAIAVRGTRLALRRSDAGRIGLVSEAAASPASSSVAIAREAAPV